jgi:hypothetical protein
MNYMIIENNKVVNIAVATPDVAAERGWIACPEGVGIGWIYNDNGNFSPPDPDAEGEAAKIRARRDRMLQDSDVIVLPDRWAAMTTEQQQAWTIYRQALRDVTAQSGFPWTIEWPTQP